jgi:hypothetical protein
MARNRLSMGLLRYASGTHRNASTDQFYRAFMQESWQPSLTMNLIMVQRLHCESVAWYAIFSVLYSLALFFRKLILRLQSQINCNVGGWGPAGTTTIQQGMAYLRGLGNRGCRVGGRSCTRISCSYRSAIWLCNDNDWEIAPACNYLLEYAGNIIGKCKRTNYFSCRTCPFGVWTDHVTGQQFDTDRYNIIVREDGSNGC